MRKNYLLLFFCLAVISQAFSQATGSIQGKIITEQGAPVSGANIFLEELSRGTESNMNGRFTLYRLPEGSFTLRISYLGYQTNMLQVQVRPGERTELQEIQLKFGDQDLEEVIVTGNANINDFARNKSEYVAKLPLKEIENPQVYNVITAELLEDQVVTSFDDAVKNAPGITKLWESTGRGGDGTGYFSLRGFAVQPTLVNGLPGLTNASPDPASIERIEVVKGPSGTLFGSSLISYGGLINIVTKKPYDHFGGNVSYTLGSFGLHRVTADVNTPLDAEGKAALRVNTAYHKQNSFQDFGFQESFFVAPSLSYEVNDRLSFLVNTEIYRGESTNPLMLFLDRAAPLRAHNVEELGYNPEKSYTSNHLTMENPNFSLQGQMNYGISDSWTSQTVFSRGSARAVGNYSYLYETTQYHQGREEEPGAVTNLDSGLIFTRYMNQQNSTTLTTDIQQNFNGDFELAGLRNRMVVGVDYFNRKVIDNSSGYVSNGMVYIGNASQQNVNESVYSIYDPANYRSDYDSGNLTEAGAEALLAGASLNQNTVKEEVYSAYISDVINFTPKLSAMASLRIDQFESETNSQTALSPKFGLVYQPVLERISVFANYMDGFSNTAPMEQGDPSQGVTSTVNFDPERARQLEIGTKLNLVRDRVSANISYYDIRVSNMVMEETGRPFHYVQDGEQYSRGFEASLTATPLDGLNLIAGYGNNESKLTKSDQTDLLGRRPETAGPEHTANLWASYTLLSGKLQGFGLAAGGNYASENMIFNRQLGVFTVPSYTLLNASVSYKAEDFSVNLKLNNLLDEEYYTGWSTINPQMPMNYALNFSYNF